MSQEKAQLIAPIENITVTGVVATGVITATSFDGNVTGSASSIVQGANVVAGIVTAGLNTTTAFSGNLTGDAGGLSGDPDIHVGVLTATSFVGNVTGIVTGRATGLSNTGAGTSNLNIGTFTATTFYGDGSSLSGVAGAAFRQQSIGITSATTTIDLSNGNVINANQSANTTVSFANTAGTNEVYIFRDKDATTTVRTITWPASIKWDGGTEPTLTNVSAATTEGQIFKLTTVTNGETWYGKEVYDDRGSYALFAWGFNQFGYFGNNTSQEYRSSPVLIGGGNPWTGLVKISDWASAGFGYQNDGSIWTTGGNNSYGTMGLNTATPAPFISSPTQIGTDTDWTEGGVTSSTSVFSLKTNGSLWAWGRNDQYGHLGVNDIIQRSSPTQIPGTTWSTVGAAENTILATRSNNTMWVWGLNNFGQVAKNDTNNGYSSPTQLGAGDDWAFGCGNKYSLYASKTDNTLWIWGANEYGMLGLNQSWGTPSYGAISSPTQIPGTNWGNTRITMSAGNRLNMFNIKTNGTLWSWGYGGHGTLGVNDILHRSSPIQVGSDNTWASIGVVGNSAFATKTDGTTWTWGSGGYGYQGHNDIVSRSSPTLLPGKWRPDCGGAGNYGGIHLQG